MQKSVSCLNLELGLLRGGQGTLRIRKSLKSFVQILPKVFCHPLSFLFSFLSLHLSHLSLSFHLFFLCRVLVHHRILSRPRRNVKRRGETTSQSDIWASDQRNKSLDHLRSHIFIDRAVKNQEHLFVLL